jgi:hypothetical protein
MQIQTLAKINSIISKALNGNAVTLAQLRSVLTTEQFANYQDSLDEVTHKGELLYGSGMPEQLKPYNILLRDADFAWNKYESMAGKQGTGQRKYKYGSTRNAEYKSQHMYEHALEKLEEIFGCAERGDWGGGVRSQLNLWMDREIDFDKGVESNIGIGAGSMPRVRGSKSHNALDSGMPKLSKRLKQQWCALLALLEAAYNIAFMPLPVPVQDDADVRNRIEKLRTLQQKFRDINSEKD